MDYSFVAGKAIDSLRGSIGRVVVDNNQIEFEVRFLFQDRVDGIGNGAYTVPYGNDYRSLVFEIVGVEFDLFEYRFEITAYFFQVFGTCGFHFYLYAPIFGIYIIEYFLSAFSGIVFDFGIEIFVNVY